MRLSIYDLLYRDKDYGTEADFVARMICRETPDARSILKLGSGTSSWTRLAALGFKMCRRPNPRPRAQYALNSRTSFELIRLENVVMQNRAATALMELCGRAGRVLPDVRGRGRIAISLSSLLMKAGADPIIEGRMASGHRMRLDCRVPSHCWAFFSGRYDDSKIAVLLSLLRPGGTALDVGANIGFYTVPLAIQAKAIGSKVVAFEPLANNSAWLRHNLDLNDCVDVVQVIESALGNESGVADIVLTDDFFAGGTVGNATIMSQALYEERFAQFARTGVKIDTLDRSWSGVGRIDVVKVDVEGYETQFLQGGRNTIAVHRPALLIEVNRVHQALRGIDFNEAVPSLLPAHYFFAELRASGIVQIHNLAECVDADIMAIPEERRQEIAL